MTKDLPYDLIVVTNLWHGLETTRWLFVSQSIVTDYVLLGVQQLLFKVNTHENKIDEQQRKTEGIVSPQVTEMHYFQGSCKFLGRKGSHWRSFQGKNLLSKPFKVPSRGCHKIVRNLKRINCILVLETWPWMTKFHQLESIYMPPCIEFSTSLWHETHVFVKAIPISRIELRQKETWQ